MYNFNKKSLASELWNSLNSLSEKFIDIFSLSFKGSIYNSQPLIRWLDFLNRYVPPKPRSIKYSDRFPKANLTKNTATGLNILESLFTDGQNVNPYQGRGLTLRNDTSGENRKAKTDLLFADWGILHFHLTEKPLIEGDFFSKPADYLLFCIISDESVLCIDILPHPDFKGFSEPSLIETAHRNWPEYLESYKVGVNAKASTNNQLSRDDINHYRTLGINCPFELSGVTYYSPGLGMMANGVSCKVFMNLQRLNRDIETLAKMIAADSSLFQKELSSSEVMNPIFSFELSERGLVLGELNSKIAFVFPKRDTEVDFLAEISELMLPDWVISNDKVKKYYNLF